MFFFGGNKTYAEKQLDAYKSLQKEIDSCISYINEYWFCFDDLKSFISQLSEQDAADNHMGLVFTEFFRISEEKESDFNNIKGKIETAKSNLESKSSEANNQITHYEAVIQEEKRQKEEEKKRKEEEKKKK